MSTLGLTPLPPPRISSNQKVSFQGPQSWRESLGMFLCLCLAGVVLVSVISVGIYVLRNRAVYEELVDYLDKTISISKINYNHQLGLYTLSEKELEVLNEQRTYKNELLLLLVSDVGCYVFLTFAILLYFAADVSQGKLKVLYWILVGLAVVYAVVQVHLFMFILQSYSEKLPNATEQLLNHAIPHNPGGLMQMEQRLDCTFDHNLYAANKRRMNPKNTCDPSIESSFIPFSLLLTLGVLRLVLVVVVVLLAARKTPLSEAIALGIEKIRPGKLSQKKRQSTYQTDFAKGQTTTTFAANNEKEGLPPAPSPGEIDHSISYNNAAYFATSGAYGLNSSRSSEISRIDAIDLHKPTYHNSGSIMSEV